MNTKKSVGRPVVEKPRETISVRIDPELLQEVRAIPDLSLTQAVENGLKLVLTYRHNPLQKIK